VQSDPADAALGRASAQQFTVVIASDPTSSAAQRLVGDIRALPGPDRIGTLVGGRTAALIDAKHSIGAHLPWALLIVVAATFALLFLFTGSVIQPIRALIINGLSLSAALGVMTWIFQDGHLASLLDVTPRPMDTSMTVLALCLAFGLSMDYEVFLTSRIKEMHDQGADTTDAVVHGLARTGRIVSTAAGLLSVTFFAFATSTVSFLQMLGLGAGLAVLLDATLIRGVLVPSVTALAGERIWYAPSWLRAVHRRVGLSEGPVTEQPDSRYSQLAHADNG
jgi:RND superfamily putative drug exporter